MSNTAAEHYCDVSVQLVGTVGMSVCPW